MTVPSRSLGVPVTAAEPVCREVLVIIQCYVDCECDVSTMLAVATEFGTEYPAKMAACQSGQ